MTKRLLLLVVLLVSSGCDGWMEKLAPAETGFARHCFDLLQHRDFAAIEAVAAPSLRDAALPEQLSEIAARIPVDAPISGQTIGFSISTKNGYTTSRVQMAYHFQQGWLEFDILTAGPSNAPAVTALSVRPTAAPNSLGAMPILSALPPIVLVLGLIGVVIYRRRARRREALQITPAIRERRQTWSASMDGAGMATPWLGRVLGVRRVALTSPLSPEECARRLQDSIDGEWTLFRRGNGPRSDFQGSVGRARFRIYKKQSVFLASRYQTFLYGSLTPDGAGTRLNCSLGPQRLLFGVFGGFLLFAWIMFPTVVVGQNGFSAFALVSLIGPLLVTVFVVLGFSLNRRRVLEGGPALLDLLGQTLDAAPTRLPPRDAIKRATR